MRRLPMGLGGDKGSGRVGTESRLLLPGMGSPKPAEMEHASKSSRSARVGAGQGHVQGHF